MEEKTGEARPAESAPAPRFLVLLAAFSCGWALMSIEILGSRVLDPNFGSGIFTWGSLISTFLVALSAGYLLGGWLSKSRPRLGVLAAIMAAAGLLVATMPLYLDAWSDRIVALDLGDRGGPLCASICLFGLPAIMLGMVSPYCVRLGSTHIDTVGATSGSLYAVSTIGSTAGTLVTAFWLIPEMGVRSIFQWTGSCLVALALLLGLAGAVAGAWRASGRRRAMAVPAADAVAAPRGTTSLPGLAVVSGGLLLGLVLAPACVLAAEQIIFQKDSVYSRVIVGEEGSVRVLRSARKGVASEESRVDMKRPLAHLNEYTAMVCASLAFVPRPRDVLVIGLGAGVLPRTFRHYYPDVSIDTVELDPMVVDVARKYFDFRPDARSNVITSDGRVYVKRCQKQYDIVILDAFQGTTIPFHLKTREFLQQVKRIVRAGGVVVSNLHRGPRLYSAERQTYQAAFPTGYAFAGVRSGNLVLVSLPAMGPRLPASLLVDYATRVQAERRFDFNLVNQVKKLDERVDWDVKAPVLTDDYAPVETLNRP